MNRKEYELVARNISQGRGNFKSKTAWTNFTKALAYELSITYSNFDTDKFLAACGLEAEGNAN